VDSNDRVEPGRTVAAQFTAPELFIIAENLGAMELRVAVAEADIGKVAKGQKATFNVDAWPDRSFTAEVSMVSFGSEVVSKVVTYDTELQMPNEDGSLRPGMTATAEIDARGKRGVLIVTNMSLRFGPTRAAAGRCRRVHRRTPVVRRVKIPKCGCLKMESRSRFR
jgi:HlyD family secretion protein